MTKLSPNADVAIVGGGVAGLAAGIGFARLGLSTLVFEKKAWPIDKACGEGLMPHGVAELLRLGLLERLSADDSHPFEGIELISQGGRRMRATFSDGPGLGVRRTALSKAMYEAALQQPNLTLYPATRVLHADDFESGVTLQTLDQTFSAQMLVAADGIRSVLRSRVSPPLPMKVKRYGANQHFRIAPWNTHVEVYLSDGLEAYVTPCGRSQVGVAFLWHYERFTPKEGREGLLAQCLERFPLLSERLSGCEAIGPLQTTGPMYRGVTTTSRGRLVLLGDAAGYYDAITGEGMSLALRQARALSQIPWPPVSFEAFVKEQARMKRANRVITGFSLMVAQRPWLQNLVFSLFQGESRAFRFFLSLK